MLRAPAPASAPARPPPLPWLDRRGNVCPLRLPVFILLLLPGLWMAVQWATGGLGAEPAKAAIHETGLWALRLLLLTLAITPLRWLADWPQIAYVRRQVGVGTFCYALAHLLLFVVHQNFDLLRAALEILRRVYLLIGLVALLGLGALALTSTDGWVRRMGKRWKRLHLLVFPVALLATLHFFLQSKADVSEPVLVSGLLAWLLAWRALPEAMARRPSAPFLLAPVAALGAAGIEYVWCSLATNLPAGLILRANLDLTFGPRPAVWSGIIALGLALAMAARRALRG